ncbi:MAG: TlpA disulfide reductase family protein [Pirellulales bacterium]
MVVRTLVGLGIFGIFAIVPAATICFAEPSAGETGVDPVAAELEQLGADYDRVQNERIRALPPDGGNVSDQELSDDEWMRQGREWEAKYPDPDLVMLPGYVALAEKYPQSPFALDALAFVIMRGGYHTGDVHGEPWQFKEQAIDLVAKHHMADPRVAYVFKLLAGSLPSQKAETFLRQALERDPNRTVRAAAGYNLACYYRNLGKAHARSKQIMNQSAVANHERFWKLVVAPYLEKEFPYDEAQVSAEIDQVLGRVSDEYADVAASQWNWSGPNRKFLQAQEDRRPNTYGSLARSLRFELNHLVPGRQAPEIEGTDAAGNRFRLSDYRGKVVLLTFSANWCGGCVELYPLQRKLVEQFRDEPFVLLSVSRDENVETLRESIASGKITWRCWWDGMEGPIYQSWNSPGAPTIFVLDHRGIIQDVHLNRATPPIEFEHVISQLLSKASAND